MKKTTNSDKCPARVDVTVAICTWNRAELLRKTLDQMTQLEAPLDFNWELFIIDNQCTDNTRFVAESYQTRLPVRIESEKYKAYRTQETVQ